MDDTEAAANSPRPMGIGSKLYKIRQLTFRNIGTLNAFIAQRAKDPLDQLKEQLGVTVLEDLPDDEREGFGAAWKMAERARRTWKPPNIISGDGFAVLTQDEDGILFFVDLLFSLEQDLADGEAREIMMDLSPAMIAELFRYAMGMEGSDPKGERGAALLASARSALGSSRRPSAESSPRKSPI